MMTRPRPGSRTKIALVLCTASFGCTAPDAAPTTPAPAAVARVVLVGDSLAQEASADLAFLLGDVPLVPKYYGGTAPCDWLDDDLEADDASVVVISFTGNSQTPCMSDGPSSYVRGAGLVDRYRQDVATLVERSQEAGAVVVLVGQPSRGNDPAGASEVDGLNSAYRSLAITLGADFVDAGASVELDDGAFTLRLPCTPMEPACDPDGTNAVRSDDGVHFCPGRNDLPCPRYSSGALRFALAISDAVTRLVPTL